MKKNDLKRSAKTKRRSATAAVARMGPGRPAKEQQAEAARATPAPVLRETSQHVSRFPIVGIGASAGGLEALEQFLRHTPPNSGMAFVVIQHLDPTHKGMLVELLQRATVMPVTQVDDLMPVQPDHVYVIPPNKDMSLLHGRLHLIPPASPRGMNLPIDFFLRSLAEDHQERAIGVILSGMGSDGTLGLRAVKEKAGAAFVQSLPSAKFDGMPRSAIEAGLADVVAPVEDLPNRILTYRQHAPHMREPESALEDKAQSALDKVFVLLRAQTGNDFSLYKRSTIYRRIERRMGLHQIDNVAEYVHFLRENRREIDLLFKELLIGVTSFFRDPATWEHMKRDVMPALVAARAAGGVLRAWVPGCSTGEEAYSLAIVFKEVMEPFKSFKAISLQIFATDLDRDAIDKARQGIYPDHIAADVSPERLRRFFVREDRGYRVSKEIREMVVFATQNLIMDPPFTKLDILSCRNLLIYLSTELQRKLIPLFHYALNPGGVLFLGTAETVGSFTNLFASLDARTRLYRRLDRAVASVQVEFPSSPLTPQVQAPGEPEAPAPRGPAPLSLQALADRVLVQRFSPVGVLCNDKGDILYISGRAGKYLEPAVGKANLNVFAMAREGLRYELSSAFSAALRGRGATSAIGVKVGTNGATQLVDISVQKLQEPRELRGAVMIIFTEAKPPAARPVRGKSRRTAEPSRLTEVERELQRTREEIQTTREEMQTSQEELKSTNEELQSTNEELQSTNEELTTSKEEMQSLNEELQTVNHELQAKLDELSRSNNDMKNLLNSTDIATLFLDGELNVRRFTTPTSKIIKLKPGDAGRPITDIASDLDYSDLADDARDVLRTLVFREKQVGTKDGRWYSVRIMPYRTVENVIDGVVITFTDSSASRALETALREQANQLRQVAESLPALVWGCRADGVCDYLSRRWVEYTGIPDAEQHGYRWLEQVHPEDRERVRQEWRNAVSKGASFDAEFRIRGTEGAYCWFWSRAVPIRDGRGAIVRWYGSSLDIDDLKRAKDAARGSAERLTDALDGLDEGAIELDEDLRVASLNAAAERAFGCARSDVVGKVLFVAFPELLGSAFEEKLRAALAEGAPTSFEAHLNASHDDGWYAVRVHRSTSLAGNLVLFRRTREQPPKPA